MKKLLAISLLFVAGAANATLLTSNPGYSVTDDFSSREGSGYNFLQAPVDMGDYTISCNNYGFSNGNCLAGEGSYGFGGNGYWNNGRGGYAAVNSRSASMTMMFDFALSGVGGFFNYAPYHYGTPIIAALDSLGNVLESHVLSINVSGANNGRFFAIDRAAGDIWGFRMSNAYLAVDNLTYGRATDVPLPGTLGLVLAAAMGLFLRKRLAKA